MACKGTDAVDGDAAGRRWPTWLAHLVALVTALLLLAGVGAGQATTRPAVAAAATAATRPLPVVQAVPTPATTTSVPSTTSAAPPVTRLPATPSAVVPTVTAGRPAVTRAVPAPPDACAVALAYLAAHAAPGFAHFCRPGSLRTAMGASTAYTCLPGTGYSCPDGVAEIIIAEPTCAASYENEASNSSWDFSHAGVVKPGTVQNGRVWDPYGACP